MRRLMTGYAVTFNKRHKRSGHLFQNRYKSIVCEEDPYLLELIRYIHLNPIRAGLVKDLKELDKYPWSGHSSVLGKRSNLLIPNKGKKNTPSAGGGLVPVSFVRKLTEQQKNPDNPARPVKFEDHFTGVNPACPVGAKHRTGVKDLKSLAEKTIEDVLCYFGDTLNVARRKYRQFTCAACPVALVDGTGVKSTLSARI
jgi:putative transposase